MNPSAMATSQAASSTGASIVAGTSRGAPMISRLGSQETPDSLLDEVQGENSAYYKAYVTDICDTEVLLRFEDDWQPESKFAFSR